MLLSDADRISGHIAAMLDGKPVPDESAIEVVAAAG